MRNLNLPEFQAMKKRIGLWVLLLLALSAAPGPFLPSSFAIRYNVHIQQVLTIDGKIYNPYVVLDVPRDASLENIKKAYRVLRSKYDPNRNSKLPPEELKKIVFMAQKIQLAYDALENRRKDVDDYLAKVAPAPKPEAKSQPKPEAKPQPKSEIKPQPQAKPQPAPTHPVSPEMIFTELPKNATPQQKAALRKYRSTYCNYTYGKFVDTKQ